MRGGRFIVGVLTAAALLCASGCASQSLDHFIEQKLGSDDGFQSALKACKSAQDAYHLIADTPLEELAQPAAHEAAARLVAQSRDSYRRSITFAINSGRRRLELDSVRVRDPNKGLVQLGGVTLCVAVMPEYVELKQVLSSRGKEILRFDSDMKLVVATEFRPFMIGDEVQVDTDFLLRVRRSLGERERIDVSPRRNEW